MNTGIARTDTSILGNWWWTVDRWTLAAVFLLIGLGAILVVAASPPVAGRIGLDEFHFVERHLILLGPSILGLLFVSVLSPVGVCRLSLLVFAGAVLGVCATLVVGTEIKGATRWIHLPGMSLQPSELIKPAFAVISAWLFTQRVAAPGFPGWTLAFALYLLVVLLLLLQPDFGMAVVITAVWGVQFFIAGLPTLLVLGLAIATIAGMVGAYYTFDHVASRIDRFFDPSSGDSYQIDRSLEAFANGGAFGVGPGEGTVKLHLPDAHADFVFAVAGEEFGLLWCLVLVGLFAVIVLRALARAGSSGDLFTMIAVTGLATQFGLQALINMGSALHVIPTKGMTLPFVSYGGSSLLAVALTVGWMLALTRRRSGGSVAP